MARKSTDFIVIHCAATKPSMDIDVDDIDSWHRKRGFFSVGYHYVLKRCGTRQTGRSFDEVGGHAKGFNHRSIGICLVGGVSEDDHTVSENNFTKEQWVELELLLDELLRLFPQAKVIGHNQISQKDCPSFDVQAYLKDKSFKESGCEKPLS
jgi:N-acetylmuramoyl-L-alanine amidase